MSLLGMPMMVINLGGEMMYILQQRLVAQNIQPDKAKKVIADIVRTMYNPKFIQELFKPQELYSSTATRQIFDRIAHSSVPKFIASVHLLGTSIQVIMRLSESSMDKLYDLMITGFKYQIISCRTANELLEVTTNHLMCIRSMVNTDVLPMLESATALAVSAYAELSPGSFILLRQTLLRNLQDKKVKVSPFLLEGIQNTDASMVLKIEGSLPRNFQVPGHITFFLPDGTTETVVYPLPLSAVCTVNDSSAEASTLGFNLYLKSGSSSALSDKSMDKTKADAGPSTPKAPAPPVDFSQSSKSTTAKEELNLLASLLGMDSKQETVDEHEQETKETFRLHILDDRDLPATNSTGFGVEVAKADVIEIKNAAQKSSALSAVMKDMEIGDGKSGAGGGGGDDLLDLLDEAGT